MKEGYALTYRIENASPVNDHTSYRVTDDEKEQSFLICLHGRFDLATACDLNFGKDNLVIRRTSPWTTPSRRTLL